MSYLPFLVMNVVILSMIGYVFLRALGDRRDYLARVEARRRIEGRAR